MFVSFRSKVNAVISHLVILSSFLALIISTRLVTYAAGTSSSPPIKSATSTFSTTLKCGVWRVIPGLNLNASQNNQNGVLANAANDIWTVGSYGDSDHNSTLIEHWDGSSWSIISSPNVGTLNTLNAVTRVPNTNQMWAVGTSSGSPTHTLIEHWDGAGWSIIRSPDVGLATNDLAGVSAVTANNVWAVGEYSDNGSYPSQTLIEHWNGSSWKTLPYNTNLFGYLYSVVAISIKNVWAVGVGHDNTSGVLQTLIEHWNGTIWSVVSHPNPSSPGVLNAIAQVPRTQQVIAIGNYSNSNGMQTLIETNC